MKANKNQMNLLKQIANRIDYLFIENSGQKEIYFSYFEKQKISHEDMKLANQKFDPAQNYVVDVPVYRESNHYLRLKRAFKRTGINGIIEYLNKVGLNIDESEIKKTFVF